MGRERPAQLVERLVPELAAMTEHERRQHLLLVAREPRQIRVLQDVRAVLVVARIANREPHLVQARGGAEELLRLGRELPLRRLLEQLQRGRAHSLAVLVVEAVPLGETRNGRSSRADHAVLADQLVGHALSERPLRGRHRLQVQGLEDTHQNREATRDDGSALLREPVEGEVFQRPGRHHRLLQLGQPAQIDPLFGPAIHPQDLLDRPRRA